MTIVNLCNKITEYSFYALFFLVPLVFAGDTFELFEFNKMWLTFAITIVIGTAWATKMVWQRQIRIQKTLLDIPIILFLASQVISTIFSLDRHVSVWGYYSRFNGGLLSILSYIFLYYAFVSNFTIDFITMVKRLLYVILASGVVVALWGLPSHFGYDPTCLLFRGTLDVSCWTEAFQPKVRMFSTLGQPNWLAAYLAVLIPLAIALGIRISNIKYPFGPSSGRGQISNASMGHWKFEIGNYLKLVIIFLLPILFYLDLLYTSSQSGFLGAWIGIFVFGALIFWKQIKSKHGKNGNFLKIFIPIVAIFLILTFFQGYTLSALQRFTYQGLKESLVAKTLETAKSNAPMGPALEVGGTDSGKIRKIVWEGAIAIWKANPLFGTGVETYAYAYYKFKPQEHNLTSEWDYLYNKAHNEYLNYLATTGAIGLGSYLVMICAFLWLTLTKNTNFFAKFANPFASIREDNATNTERNSLLTSALLSGYISILASNFFGFSVVIINLFLFLIPAFIFLLEGLIDPNRSFAFPKSQEKIASTISMFQWTFLIFIIFTSLLSLFTLYRFWQADKAYALGYNLGRIGEYQTGYPKILEAVTLRPGEPTFKDELSVQSAILTSAFASPQVLEKNPTATVSAGRFAEQAVTASDQVINRFPNNVIFWKTRTRVFYTLSQVDSRYLPFALEAIKKASELAPTDAKIQYNLGVLYGQNDKIDRGIEVLEKTIKLKPDYRDAYFALGLFYREKALNEKNQVINIEFEKKAVESLTYVLEHLASNDAQVQQTLASWGEL